MSWYSWQEVRKCRFPPGFDYSGCTVFSAEPGLVLTIAGAQSFPRSQGSLFSNVANIMSQTPVQIRVPPHLVDDTWVLMVDICNQQLKEMVIIVGIAEFPINGVWTLSWTFSAVGRPWRSVFVLLCVYSPVKTRYYGPFVAPVVVRQYRSAVLTLISVQCQIALLTRK